MDKKEYTVAERIKCGLDLRGMRAVDLSRKTGLTKSIISQYMSGRTEPKQDNLFKISKALDIWPTLRGKHFAIVITKKDSPNNGVLTVIPLSSKEKPYYLDIGNFVSKQVYPQLLNITRELYTALANLDSSDETLNIQKWLIYAVFYSSRVFKSGQLVTD